MAAEIKKLLAEEQEIEAHIGGLVFNMYCRNAFDFFPSPELVEICKKAAANYSRLHPVLSKDTPEGEKFRVAAAISSRFIAVCSPKGEIIETKLGKKVLKKETALVVSDWFSLLPVRLAICGGQIFRTSQDFYTSTPEPTQIGDLLVNGGDIPDVLGRLGDLKKLTVKAQELFSA